MIAMDKDMEKKTEELVRQLKDGIPGWFIEYNDEYARIEFRKEAQVEIPDIRVSIQTVELMEEKDFSNMVKEIRNAIERESTRGKEAKDTESNTNQG